MFQTIISTINSFMYSKLLVIILIGAGVYFTVRTRFPQVRLFKRACGSVMEKPEDTLLLCTATAMMCMSSGIDPAKELQGAPWVQASLQESLGSFGPVFITVAMVFFAFTTLLGNCFYCDNLLIYIHKKQPGKAFMKGFRLVSALAIFLGAGMEMSLLWDLSDVLMGVMALINIPVILILSRIAVKAIQDYEVQLKQGINPVFKSADIGLSQKTDFWS